MKGKYYSVAELQVLKIFLQKVTYWKIQSLNQTLELQNISTKRCNL